MTEMPSGRPIDLGELAAESPEKSARRERDAVGDTPDTGGVTSPDTAQQDPGSDTPREDPPAGLMRARLPFGVDPS